MIRVPLMPTMDGGPQSLISNDVTLVENEDYHHECCICIVVFVIMMNGLILNSIEVTALMDDIIQSFVKLHTSSHWNNLTEKH